MRKQTARFFCAIAIVMLIQVVSVSGADQYTSLLKKQGYTVLTHPRANFGPGTIVPVDNNKQLFVGSQQECFPGLDSSIQISDITLLDSHDERDLSINAAGKYAPVGSGFLGSLAAAFGFSRSKALDVKFGATKSVDMTQITFERYFKNKTVSKECKDKLKNSKNAVIFSMARVDEMSYQFKGTRNANAKVDVNALQNQVTANGDFKWDHNNTDTFTIKQPMYVGFVAYTLKDLQFSIQESSTGRATIVGGKLIKSSYKMP